MAVPGKAELRKRLDEHGGSVTSLAREAGVSRQTVYNWLDKRGLREHQTKAKRAMRAIAKDVIYDRLMSDDEDAAFEASTFVMRHLNDDGELMLSAEVLEILRQKNVTAREAIRQFEELVIASHQATGRTDSSG